MHLQNADKLRNTKQNTNRPDPSSQTLAMQRPCFCHQACCLQTSSCSSTCKCIFLPSGHVRLNHVLNIMGARRNFSREGAKLRALIATEQWFIFGSVECAIKIPTYCVETALIITIILIPQRGGAIACPLHCVPMHYMYLCLRFATLLLSSQVCGGNAVSVARIHVHVPLECQGSSHTQNSQTLQKILKLTCTYVVYRHRDYKYVHIHVFMSML